MFCAMAAKLQSLAYSSRTPFRVYLSACISSSSCATHTEDVSVNVRNPKDSSEYEQHINVLRNKLVPENLIRVLDHTSDLNLAVRLFKWAALQKGFRHTANTYHQMILKLGMAGNVQEVGAFCLNLVKNRCRGAEEVLVALIHTFVRHCRINEAMTVFENMNLGIYKPPVEVFNVLLGVLVEESGDFQKVLYVYKEMVKAGIVPTVQTLNYLLEVLFATDRVELALDQFRRMNKKGCTPNSRTFEILVKGLIAKNRVDEAISVLEQIIELGCQLDLSFYTCTIPLFCRENKIEEGVKLYRMMKASNFAPDSLIYGVLVQCLCHNLQLDSAICLINEMMESEIPPAPNIFVDLVDCFCELCRINEAIWFLEDKHVLETPPHNALLEGCCDAGKVIEAYVLLETMSERNIADSYSWNIIIRWLCENGETRKAYELVGRMIRCSIILDSATYSAIIIGNCRLGKYENAMEVFDQVCARCWVLDFTSYSELVGGLCDFKETQEAAKVFSYMSMKKCSLDSFSFHKLIKCVCDSGQINKALRLWQLAYYSGTSCSTATHSTIMYELSKLGRTKDLFVFLSRMLIEGCNFDLEAYCILFQSMREQNQVKECVLFFNKMLNEGLLPDPDTLFDQLSFIANNSQLCMISAAIDKILSNGEVLSPAMHGLLINGLWKEGKRHEARQLLDLMLEKGWLPDAATHKLLIGCDGREERSLETLVSDNSSTHDSVSNILAEGLGDK
ncbi:hypothetical protein L6164_034914 [Bauhinia variegata]|uniref:Uncharacterized protein n=2 Tax=Bauhinia variegata TaxID=167791 RepID=A0ACB9KW57_BAUVA|nr:hypothetical protein L6164_034914 [Bauhinia variegata]